MIKMYESIFSEEEMDEKRKSKGEKGEASEGEVIPSEQILEILSSKKFSKWFSGKFSEYMEGEEGAPSKEEILADIQSTFIDEMEGKEEGEEEKKEKKHRKEKPEESEPEEEEELEEDWRSQ